MFLAGLEAWKHHDTTDTVLGRVYDVDLFRWTGWGIVGIAVALTVIRGLPVIFDALAQYGPASSSDDKQSRAV
jgi:hypothetical protein